MEIRLQKFLAHCGIASRRASEKLILSGEITINGKVITKLGVKINPSQDNVFYHNKRILFEPLRPLLCAFYKPKNCITTLKDELNRQTIAEYLPKTKPPLFPIGRLDYNSEGLILVTNNGAWAQKIAHPKYKIKKLYLVKINRILDEVQWKKISKPMMIENKLHRARVKQIHKIGDKSWVQVELYQGFNLQIKRMFLKIGVRVLKIKRVQIGKIGIQDLKVGQLRKLSTAELLSLMPKQAQSASANFTQPKNTKLTQNKATTPNQPKTATVTLAK